MMDSPYPFPHGYVPRVPVATTAGHQDYFPPQAAHPKEKADQVSLPEGAYLSDASPEAGVWDTQVGGDHYCKLKIQPFEYAMANHLDPMQHTVIKYVTRFRDKGGIADLEKAKHTIDLLIAHEKSKAKGG